MYKLCCMPSKLIKKPSILYIASRGEIRQSAEAITQWDKSAGECGTKGTQGISRASPSKHTVASGLITPASSGEKTKFL